MKKLLTLFLVLWCSTAWAAGPIDWSKPYASTNPYVAGAGVAAAADSWSCTDANVLCERFEGANSGFDNSGWTVTQAGSSTVDADYANTTAIGCNNPNTQSLRIVKADANLPSVLKALSNMGEAWIDFRIKIVSHGLPRYGNVSWIGNIEADDHAGTAISFRLYYADGLNERYFQIGSVNKDGSTVYRVVALASLPTDYLHVKIHFLRLQSVSGGIQIIVDGTDITGADTTSDNRYLSDISFWVTDYNGEIIVDAVKISTSSAPSCD